MIGPCASWATLQDLCSPCMGEYTLDETLMESKLLEASQLLYQLSGQQFKGSCSETVRVCTTNTLFSEFGLLPYSPSTRFMSGIDFFVPFSACGCRSFDGCSCNTLSAIALPQKHITAVTHVTEDGNTLDPSVYQLRDGKLVRLDGKQFSCCGEILVTYTYGFAPPLSGVTAAAVLGCELYMACDPDAIKGACRLPRNVASIARQGVSVIFKSLVTPGAKFRFGIPEIDVFLEAFSPKGPAMSAILSPNVDTDFQRVP